MKCPNCNNETTRVPGESIGGFPGIEYHHCNACGYDRAITSRPKRADVRPKPPRVHIERVMIPQTPGCTAPRWFVDIREDGQWRADRNFNNEPDAMRYRAELLGLAQHRKE